MNNSIIKNLQAASVLFFMFVTLQSSADLTSLSDNALSDQALGEISGQALFKIEEQAVPNADGITFTKMTLGLEIAMNVIIEELSIGRYHREGGSDCSTFEDMGGRFCTNTSGVFKNWQCTESDCGGFGEFNLDEGDHDTFQASALVYGNLNNLSGNDKFNAAINSILGDHYDQSIPFKNSTIFPSGFEQTTDTDIRLRHLTFGYIDEDQDTGIQEIKDFIIQKPFIQFAHDDSGGVRKIAGLRIGFGSSDGIQGQAIDVISGFVRPVIDVNIDAGALVGTAKFTFAPFLGGVRTPGYIDPDPLKTLVSPCIGTGLTLACGSVENAGEVAIASPQGQLFPLQNIVLSDSPTVWISMQSKDVLYPSDTKDVNGDTIKYEYETAKAGFWFNLGALNITKNGNSVLEIAEGTNYTPESLLEFTQLTGISGDTSKPLHPDNYFAGNPDSSKFPQINNNYYKAPADQWN